VMLNMEPKKVTYGMRDGSAAFKPPKVVFKSHVLVVDIREARAGWGRRSLCHGVPKERSCRVRFTWRRRRRRRQRGPSQPSHSGAIYLAPARHVDVELLVNRMVRRANAVFRLLVAMPFARPAHD
jgi:hypothetical protein